MTGAKAANLRLPHVEHHRHVLKRIELLGMATVESLLANIADEKLYGTKVGVAALEKSLFEARRNMNRDIEMQEIGFKARWFLWRSSLPVSVAAGMHPHHLWSTSRRRSEARPRHVWLWIGRYTGGLTYSSMANTIGRDHTTIVKSCQLVDEQLSNGNGDLVEILKNALDIEREWA